MEKLEKSNVLTNNRRYQTTTKKYSPRLFVSSLSAFASAEQWHSEVRHFKNKAWSQACKDETKKHEKEASKCLIRINRTS